MGKQLKGYVFYSDAGTIIPSSLILRRDRPRTNVRFLEISGTLCCGIGFTPVIPSGKTRLRAFVKISASGDVVAGSLIIRRSKPKPSQGKWVEIPYDICCSSFSTIPVITSQPDDQTVTVGDSANFQVVATGSPTPTYQWLLNGVEIPGATNSVYEIEETEIGMDGDEYSVVITNEAGSVISETALLTVNPVTTTTSTTTSTTTTVAP